jgi:hypothetical protein
MVAGLVVFLLGMMTALPAYSAVNVSYEWLGRWKNKPPVSEDLQYYLVWIFKFENVGTQEERIYDSYSLVTDKKQQMEPVQAMVLRNTVEKKYKIEHESIWVGEIYPKVIKHRIVIFDDLPGNVKKFTLYCDRVYGDERKIVLKYEKKGGNWKKTSERIERR